jgi:hypothetical protein
MCTEILNARNEPKEWEEKTEETRLRHWMVVVYPKPWYSVRVTLLRILFVEFS